MSVSARRAWGWHALTDEWAARIVADAQVRPGDLVIDIGAGHGALTRHLIAAGAHVIAVELHGQRIRHLRHRFAHDPVTVVTADAATLLLPRRRFRVVASPPYRITSPLLRQLLAPGSRLVAADLVLQKAVVRLGSRHVSREPTGGRVSVVERPAPPSRPVGVGGRHGVAASARR